VKRRLPLTVVLTALLLVSLAGVAWAANTIICDGTSPCNGTDEADDITGTDRAEKIIAERGPDDVRALGGPDNVVGGPGGDEADGGPGGDRISGGDGDDQKGTGMNTGLLGNGGSDRVLGGPEADDVTGGAGEDGMFGGDGNDILDSFDQERDNVVDCGPGRDIAYVDQKDRNAKIIEDCEQVQRGSAPMTAAQYRAADEELR
jgi:Ca2+-binding RTX toxin-like protein